MMGPRGGMVLALAVGLGLGGCSYLPGARTLVRARPIATPASPASHLVRSNQYYEDARTSIAQRSYAQALDRLQAARELNPDDPRVLNAFGVVYDKLGRFDLSARYYQQSRALGEAPETVDNNLAYSLAMQAAAGAAALPAAAETADAPAPPTASQSAALAPTPPVIRLKPLTESAERLAVVTLIGRPLVIVDATGQAGRGEAVRQALVRLGWSARRSDLGQAAAQPRSTIEYPITHVAVARALARTLPVGAGVAPCADDCKGIRLVLGRDAAAWRPRDANPSTEMGMRHVERDS